jgi:hypothetical protein
MSEPTAASKPTGVPDPTEDPWRAAFEEFKIRDKRMGKEFREEIDTLLVLVRGPHLLFLLGRIMLTLASQAGLFSAVVTAFVIESYQHLREDPAKTTVDLLRYISHQLANSSLPAAPDPSQFQAQQSDVRVNVCWFVSLFLSLLVALFGIFFKQWMRSYMTWMDVTAYQDAVELRHFRYRTLTGWHIETILALLPTLLQIAVVVFLGGLLTFLWGSVPSLTIVMAVLSCSACFLVVAATILPGFSQLCPYRSSLSRFVAIPIRYVLDHVKSTINPPLQAAVRSALHLAVEAVFIVAWISYARWPNLLEAVARLATSATTFVQHFIPFTFSQQSLLHWLKGQHAKLPSFWRSGDQSVTTLFTSWLDLDKGVLGQLTNERHVSMGVGAMVHLCSTTQSPGLREATIMAIMSEYPDDGPTVSVNDDAYCNEVWWPIIDDIMDVNKERIADLSDTSFRVLFFFWNVQSQFSSFSLSMQHHWLDFLSRLEDLVCRSHSEHMIKAYLICCTASVDSHGGGKRMLALVAVLRIHHLELEGPWLDSIAYSLSMSASIWKDDSDGGEVFPYKWHMGSGKLLC